MIRNKDEEISNGAGNMEKATGRADGYETLWRPQIGGVAIAAALLVAACATVKVEAPDEPIEINLNVKIDQEVRIKLDKEVEDLIADNPDIF